MKPSFVFAAFACAALSRSLPAAPRPLLQPVKPWVLDYGETACTAIRTYGTPDKPVSLALRPSPNGNVVRIGVARSSHAPDAYHFPITVGMGARQLQTTGLRFESRDRKHDIVWVNLDRSALDALPGAGEIALSGGEAIDERFALPQIAAVLRGLDACSADLRHYWHIDDDPPVVATRARPVRNPQAFVSSGDYPRQALSEHESGITRIVLLIDETGKVSDCMVEQTSGIATLDAMSCIALQERARFRPALDSAGKPVRSAWTTHFRWELP